ncbi:LysE family translocator [Methylobacterium sp. WL30]|jgi:threonine/homoserine/homoserine lactone efflux protein|uniref:LysE family translocator n=2 Tax=Methylobacterium TaxID=407 RepID=UPI0011C96CBE|nr:MULTISPECIES: LysE family translocator [unclassified Methylobacterium]TXN39811.1 LysE family translocator [Methylobacterium sp. WL93]TXN52501.1 LysE family translocator [Methylobacterium sp. WL119]TXN63930.1 LysE family translocator [Methylobacterium sp. WL30]
MPDHPTLVAYGAVILGLAITPGPNMIYLISRSIAQGRRAGLVSLVGSALGFLLYMACAAFGITALLATVPYAHDALRLAGAAYLLLLAWSAVRPGGVSPFQAADLPQAGPCRVLAMGLATTLLNPKAALLYLALLPQFVIPGHGSVLAQTLVLGLMHIALNLAFGVVIATTAGALAAGLARRPSWMRAQRWLMGGMLGAFAAKLLAEA